MSTTPEPMEPEVFDQALNDLRDIVGGWETASIFLR